MYVWRVEDKDGLGPYQSEWKGKNDLRHSHDNPHHPTGWADFGQHDNWFTSDYVFGFPDKEALEEWFDCGWLDTLLENGFRIVCYRARNIIVGRSGMQVVFLKDHKVREIYRDS